MAVFNGAGEVLSERAIVEITGNDSPFVSWQRNHWMENPLPAEAAPDSDADGDGTNNLLEYTLGTNPRRHDVQDAYSASVVGTPGQQRLVLRLAHAAVADVTPIFEMSERLIQGAWQVLEDRVSNQPGVDLGARCAE